MRLLLTAVTICCHHSLDHLLSLSSDAQVLELFGRKNCVKFSLIYVFILIFAIFIVSPSYFSPLFLFRANRFAEYDCQEIAGIFLPAHNRKIQPERQIHFVRFLLFIHNRHIPQYFPGLHKVLQFIHSPLP